MLAAIGFITVSLLITAFASSFEDKVAKAYKLTFWQFSSAFYCLATAFMIWGIASIINQPDILEYAVLTGDGLLLLATVLLLSLATPAKYQVRLSLVLGLVAVALLSTRAVYLPPEPSMQNSLLLFNTPQAVLAIIAAGFGLIWLPVSVRVARTIALAAKQPVISQLYASMYVATILASLIFLSAHRRSVIVVSFIAIGILFAILSLSNYQVTRLHKHGAEHGK